MLFFILKTKIYGVVVIDLKTLLKNNLLILSERQCQRIRDKILNRYIIDMLEDKNYITYMWREGF